MNIPLRTNEVEALEKEVTNAILCMLYPSLLDYLKRFYGIFCDNFIYSMRTLE